MRRIYLALAGVFCFLGGVWGMDRYVAPPGTIGAGQSAVPYNAWTNAATNVQWAVDAATDSETVWVSNGVYVLTNQIVVTNMIILRSVNGPEATLVDGGYYAGTPQTNRCLYLSNLSAFVSGFTFTNGASDRNGGGGVWMGAGILSNCSVFNNIAFVPGSISVGGGGIFLRPSGTVIACRVVGNLVTNITGSSYGRGGGIAAGLNFSTGWQISDCVVNSNRIVGYTASRSGGGISASGGRVRSSQIRYNSAGSDGDGGGVHVSYGALLDSCTVAVNQANLGGGSYNAGGVISNCLFSSNWCIPGSVAGIYHSPESGPGIGSETYNTTVTGHTNRAMRLAVYEAQYQLTNRVINCAIENNDALGLVIVGITTNYSIAIISNCVIRNNKGGGLSCQGYTAVIRNCLIACNTNSDTFGGLLIGSGVRTTLVSGCTIVSNLSADFGAGIRFESTAAVATVSSCIIYSNGIGGVRDVYDACAPTNYGGLQYSCIASNPGFSGAGIIVKDPLFINFAAGNYRLMGYSPCVNAGSNEDWMANAFDLDGRIRIRYGIVDMGAYEGIINGSIYSIR